MTAVGAAGLRQATAPDPGSGRLRWSSDLGPATNRVVRLLYLSVSIGSLVYAGVGLGKAFGEFSTLQPWFAWTSWIFSTAAPVLLGVLALWAPLRVLRLVAGCYGVLFLVVMLAWRPFQVTSGIPGDDSPWTNDIMTVATIAIAISWRARPVWAYVIASALCSGIVRYLSDPDVGWKLAALDLSYNLLMNCVFASLALVTRSGAARLDAAADAARIETSRQAEAAARVQQRVRIDALVHDHVLSALLIASRDDAPRAALRELAASTLATLRDESPLRPQPLTEDDFVGRLRSSVTSQSDGIGFETDLGQHLRIPAAIAQGLLEATSEAVRNSLRHARPAGSGDGATEVRRVVAVSSAPDRIRITVRDDGQGFNSRRIPPERLGVRVSILTRMETLPGGHASLESARGSGTTVTVGWTDPDARSEPRS
jgi:signal transduction histidine kinase